MASASVQGNMRRAVVFTVLPILAACGTLSSAAVSAATASGTRQSTAAASITAASTTAPSTAAAATVRAKRDGFPDSSFMVTAPVLSAVSGPGAIGQRPCRPADVKARAAMRPVVDGVDGVIRMVGRHCSLHVVNGPRALLGADGHRLPLSLDASAFDRPATAVNSGWNPHWGEAFADGDGLWGFALSGSWCGPRPAFVLVPMGDDPRASGHRASYGALKVPLSGAVPSCQGSSHAVLRPGLPGGEGNDTLNPWPDAVEPPPASWSVLQTSLRATGTELTLVLTNTTDQAIALSPCPNYGLRVSYTLVRGRGDEGGSQPLPCAEHPTVVAHGSSTYPIAGPDLSSLGSDPVKPGSAIRVQVAIAGVPTASLEERS
jgi:hypothetical protein